MAWDPHSLHSVQELPPESCTECIINQRHRDRWLAARAEEGGLSEARAKELAEQHRQDWIVWSKSFSHVNTGNPTGIIKHDKLAKMREFVKAHHGEEVTIQQVMNETAAASGTAYSYIREMALEFRRVGTSRYRVTDPARHRAETLSGMAVTIDSELLNDHGGTSAAGNSPSAIERPNRGPSKP